MKKIFGLLLSIWIPIYILFALLASCSKSNARMDDTIPNGGIPQSSVIGNWQMTEFYQDNGAGQGVWVAATQVETVAFSTSGDFSASQNITLPVQKFNKYRVVDSTHVELYSTSAEGTAIFNYRRESNNSLLFNDQCNENCARRFKLVN